MDEEIEIKDKEGKQVYDENGEKKYKSIGIVSSYYFWMQNRLQYYERNYKKVQDILSEIGGLSRTVFIIATIINSIFSNYITLLDTEEFILSIDNTNYYNEKVNNQKPIIIYKKDENMFPPKKVNFNNSQNGLQQSSNIQKFNKDGDYILESTISQNKYSNKKILINTYNTYNKEENESKNIDIKIEKEKKKNKKKRNRTKEINNKLKEASEKKTINKLLNEPKKEDATKQNKKQNFNWFKYIWYKICCGRNNSMISYYEDYRTKLISEESLISGQLDIFKLVKICKLEE